MYKDDSSTKAAFVRDFGMLLTKYEIENIKDIYYSVSDKGNETVTILLTSGTIEVNVNLDSLAAIIRDIMKKLKG